MHAVGSQERAWSQTWRQPSERATEHLPAIKLRALVNANLGSQVPDKPQARLPQV